MREVVAIPRVMDTEKKKGTDVLKAGSTVLRACAFIIDNIQTDCLLMHNTKTAELDA